MVIHRGSMEQDSRRMRPLLSRGAITTAARAILVAEGYPALSLRRVAGSLGVTAPALYAHVKDKRDLLQCIAEQEFEELTERLLVIAEPDPVERIRAQAMVYVRYALENPDLFRVMFLFRPELTSEPWCTESPLAGKAFEVGAQTVRDAVGSGGLKAMDPALTAVTLWSAVHGITMVLLYGLRMADYDPITLAEVSIDTVLAGLRPQS